MSDASQAFSILIPAGNGVLTSAYYPLAIGLAEVTRCIIAWPAGCCGNVGASLLAANTAAFPRQSGVYLAFEDYTYAFDVSNQIQTGNWGIEAYNTDYFDHTLYIVLEYDYVLTSVASSPSTQISI